MRGCPGGLEDTFSTADEELRELQLQAAAARLSQPVIEATALRGLVALGQGDLAARITSAAT